MAHNRIDRYPTRTAEHIPHQERPDATVWGTIDNAELADFDRDGYVIIEDLLAPEEVAAFAHEVRRLAEDPQLRGDERLIVEKSSQQVRSAFEVHQLSAAIAKLAKQPNVVGWARKILGSEVYLHQSRVNYLPGFGGTGFYWHSDFETWHAEDGMPAPRAVSLSIALTDNHPYNGSLMVMPGSHRTFVPCQGATPADHYQESLKEQHIGVPAQSDIEVLADKYGIAQFTGDAGSALLFDSNIMHGSANNITPFPRSNIFLVFNSVENALDEPFAAPQRRPNYIASRAYSPI